MKIHSRRAISHWLLSGMFAAGAMLAGCLSPQPLAVDLDGEALDPFADNTHTSATVLIFVSNDCPIANRYTPELRRLQADYASRGVNFWLVHADPAETPASIRAHAREFGLTIRELRDPEHHLVNLAHAEVTPTAAVFTAERKLVYRGRIDDRVADLHREHSAPLHHDLADALDAVMAGRGVAVATTPVIGCNIPGLR